MKVEEKERVVQGVLAKHPEVIFAYMHGSSLSSLEPRDVDIAVYLIPARYAELKGRAEISVGYAIPLEMEMERALGQRVDVQVLNSAPLSFRYRVVSSGRLLADNAPDERADFESLTRVEYYDFRPRLEEYLREAVAK
jgi:predicted nucleotidyltransferase